jgi:iron-sulfur cluster repair protein YtfE (RIC family)
MLERLKCFVQDTILHIHKEDHLLFPRALETQAALRESASAGN